MYKIKWHKRKILHGMTTCGYKPVATWCTPYAITTKSSKLWLLVGF